MAKLLFFSFLGAPAPLGAPAWHSQLDKLVRIPGAHDISCANNEAGFVIPITVFIRSVKFGIELFDPTRDLTSHAMSRNGRCVRFLSF